MSPQQREFGALMEQLLQGSQDAAWELIEQYGSHIRRVVRRTLSHELRSKFDSVDFVQAVWASIFRHRAQLGTFSSPENLIAFLVTVAEIKVNDENRRRLRWAKYNVRREQSLDDAEALPDKGPRPSEVAIAREEWERMLNRQPKQHQLIVEMRLAGMTFREIAAALAISERTARRVIDALIAAKTGRFYPQSG